MSINPLKMSNIVGLTNCEANEAIGQYFWMKIVSFVDIVSSLLTLVFEIMLLLNVRKHRIYCHINFRILVTSFCMFFALHAVSSLLMQLFNQYSWRFGEPCTGVLIRWQCVMFRAPLLLAVIGFSFNHMIFFFDRAMATINPARYERTNNIFGFIGVFIIGFAAAILVLFTIYDNTMDVSYPYCLLTAQSSGGRLHIIYMSLIGFDIVVLMGDAYLRKLSHKRASVRDLNIAPERYALGEQVQLRENQITTSWLFPFAILHVSMFFIFLIVTTIYRTLHTNPAMTPEHVAILEGMHSLVCIYAFFANVLNLKVYIQLYKERAQKVEIRSTTNDGDVYFQIFSKQLDNVVKVV